jgi:D-glycero-alpha-D-manno-heptose-7-phosphate kinase
VASLHRIRELAEAMRDALLREDLREFGLLLHEGWENKKKVSSMISNPTIDRMYSLACENGAVGGKITGAGGGGFMLLYCDEENQPAVRQAFLAQGIREMKFAFDFNGSRVLVNEPFLDKDHPDQVKDENCPPQKTFAAGAQASVANRKFSE